ncbi:MAG: TonB-dependent receptor [Sphingobium sp.]|nr:TonB-dependent receptor [Sphingobium sp.]
MNNYKKYIVTTLLSGTAIAMPVSAQAQDENNAGSQDIIVTGSLIARPNNVAASPVVSMSSEAIQQSGAINLETALNQLPGFTPAGNAGALGAGGRATLNLHGLGSNRNLVLLDGRRLPVSDINGNVDINIIPESIIGDIDVITGGASAVYGSDAMSGVVNFKTIKAFDGIKADVQLGNATRGDLRRFNGSLAFGSSFAEDRGHLMVALSYADRQGLLGSQRSFFDKVTPSSFIGQGTYVPQATNLPSQSVLNAIFANYGVNTPVNPTFNLGFNDNGSLFVQTGAVNYQGPQDSVYSIIGGNVRMPVGPQVQPLSGMQRKSAFAKFDYELTDTLTTYGQFLYVDTTSKTATGGSLTQFGTLTTIPVTNPFIPGDLQTLLASRPNASAAFTWNGRYVGLPAKAWDENYVVQQYLGGVKGDIAGGWKFDVFASYDQTVHHSYNYNAVLKSRVQTLLNAPDGGNSICAGGFNPFGLTNSSQISAACREYMTKTSQSREKLAQTQVQGLISGPLFTLPGGDVQLALQAGYRKNTYSYTPDSDLASQNIEATIASAGAKGEITVKEFAAQIDVPLIKDTPFIHELGIGGAFRYSDYSTSGSVTSYEGDVRWSPVRSLMFRGSYQRAVRAPNIGELFSPRTGIQIQFGTPPAGIGDPCDVRSIARTGANGAQVRDLCLAQGVPLAAIDSYQFPTTATGGIISGNGNLKPEKADTYNIGFIWNAPATSPWLSGISLSVDYYNIKINNVISTIPGLTTLSSCYNLDGANPSYSASNSFCQLLTRDSQGLLETIGQPYMNLGALQTDGVEIQAGWSLRLSDAGMGSGSGRVYINSAIGFTNHYKIKTLPTSVFQDFAGTNTVASPRPSWKALTTVGYGSDGVSFGLRWQYMDGMKDITSVTTPTNPAPGVGAYNLFDLFGTARVNDAITLRAGINNLFDKGLMVVSSSQNSTDVGTYDAVGRSFYVGARVNF